jgi:hypothetical protein
LVEKLVKPKPFENLTFNAALRLVLTNLAAPTADTGKDELNKLLEDSMALARKEPTKAASPRAQQWAALVPELKNKASLTTWKALCDHLKIQTGGDSARRRLKNWVKEHKPHWPAVQEIEGD